jgi:hypothetical protein
MEDAAVWRSLADPDLLTVYRGEFPGGHCPEPLGALLADLATREYADRVFAVTSLHHLRLSASPSWQSGHRHDCIFLGLGRDPGSLAVWYRSQSGQPGAGRQCLAAEAGGLVDLLVFRLLSEYVNRAEPGAANLMSGEEAKGM